MCGQNEIDLTPSGEGGVPPSPTPTQREKIEFFIGSSPISGFTMTYTGHNDYIPSVNKKIVGAYARANNNTMTSMGVTLKEVVTSVTAYSDLVATPANENVAVLSTADEILTAGVVYRAYWGMVGSYSSSNTAVQVELLLEDA